MLYDVLLDEFIYKILFERNKIHFNELLRQVNERYKTTTRRRLSIHLKKNEEWHIITRDKFTSGISRNIWLTEEAKLQMELGIFEGVKSNTVLRNIEDRKRQIKKAIIVILFNAVSGSKYFREAKEGNIVLQAIDGKDKSYVLETKEGIGIDDFFLHTRHGITHGALREVNIDSDTIEKCLSILCDLRPPVLRKIGIVKDITRYGYVDELLGKYMQECEFLLSYALTRMEAYWRMSKPKSSEKSWYTFLVGEKRMKRFFLAEKNQNNYRRNASMIKQTIENMDEAIHEQFEILNHPQYVDIKEKYALFCKLVEDVVRPRFLNFLIKK